MDNKVMPLKEGMPVDPMEQLIQKAEHKLATVVEQLDAKIPRDVISKRDAGAGKKLDYLEGWYVINRMNEIFGQGRWSYDILSLEALTEDRQAVLINDKYYIGYRAVVRVSAMGTSFTDVGYGDGQDRVNPIKPHELASKEAVTDAIKRCCKNFGMSMGLALYDKSQENVDEGEVESKAGAGDSKRAMSNKPTSSKTTTGTTNTTAPVNSTNEPGGSKGEETLVSKAKSREELNALISAAARAAVAKKIFADMVAVRSHMQANYGTDKKEALTDDQAKAFLAYLDTVINKE